MCCYMIKCFKYLLDLEHQPLNLALSPSSACVSPLISGNNILIVAHASSLEACTCQLQGLSPQNSKDFVQMVRKVIASKEQSPGFAERKNNLQPAEPGFVLSFTHFRSQEGEGEGFERLRQSVRSGAHLR